MARGWGSGAGEKMKTEAARNKMKKRGKGKRRNGKGGVVGRRGKPFSLFGMHMGWADIHLWSPPPLSVENVKIRENSEKGTLYNPI